MMPIISASMLFFATSTCTREASAFVSRHDATPTSHPPPSRLPPPRGRRRASNWQRAVTFQPQVSGGHPPDEEPPRGLIETSAYEDKRGIILKWLGTLTSVERAEPTWVGRDVLTLSPSLLAQEHLDGLYPGLGSAPDLFPTEADRARFDFEWRYCLLSLVPPAELGTILECGMSNTHPLRLQLVACPPGSDFGLHAHPAVELYVPLVGGMSERRAESAVVPRESLTRRAEHEVGAQGGLFTAQPTPDQLRVVADDLAGRATFGEHGADGAFVDRSVSPGEAHVNEVGSVHQSYTGPDAGCLLWVLGPNVHASFRPGNFRQRTGIDGLRGIDHLLEGGPDA